RTKSRVCHHKIQGGPAMKYALSISAALLLAMSQVQPSLSQNGANDLVKQAIAAEGGADALGALKGLAIKGEAKFWEPEQSEKAGGEPRFLGDATFTVTWDLAKEMARTEWDRDQKYPDPPVNLKYTETVSPTLGYVTDDKGSRAMSGIRVATHLRELGRASPWLLVKAMDAPRSVAAMGNQKLGKQSLPAVSSMDNGSKFTIRFDSKTQLPAAIRTRDDDNIPGDSDYDLVLGQQPDRRDEGSPRPLRCPLRRAAIAPGHRRGEGKISGQADQVSRAHASPYGPHRQHADLHSRGCPGDRAEPGQDAF